jgi:hypothetical protein
VQTAKINKKELKYTTVTNKVKKALQINDFLG